MEGALACRAAFGMLVVGVLTIIRGAEALWCVARSEASDDALQTALDYACGAGADCAPIQETGLCFLPNTIQAHASYAFNSYYQRKYMAPGACDFSGTATLAKTDPSYGSCVYPASSSAAGGITGTPGTTTTPSPYVPNTTPTATPITTDGGAGFNPTTGPPLSTTDSTAAPPPLSSSLRISSLFTLFSLVLL